MMTTNMMAKNQRQTLSNSMRVTLGGAANIGRNLEEGEAATEKSV